MLNYRLFDCLIDLSPAMKQMSHHQDYDRSDCGNGHDRLVGVNPHNFRVVEPQEV